MKHKPDPKTPISETLAALTGEVGTGRTKTIGCGNYSAVQLREALDTSIADGYCRFEVTQPAYSLVATKAQDDLFPICQREDIAATTYSPLAAGFLTGKYTADRSTIPKGTRFHISPGHVDAYFSEKNFRVVERLREKAAVMSVPMVQLAMAWAMSHPAVTAVLIGARTTAHIDNALAAFRMKIDPELRAEMSSWI